MTHTIRVVATRDIYSIFLGFFLKSFIKYCSVFLISLYHAVNCCGEYVNFRLLLTMLYVLTGPPLRVVCGNQLGCCLDTHLSVAASAKNRVIDETETSVCPPLSPAMEAINMEASISTILYKDRIEAGGIWEEGT
jgi:hypothetical protein